MTLGLMPVTGLPLPFVAMAKRPGVVLVADRPYCRGGPSSGRILTGAIAVVRYSLPLADQEIPIQC